MCLEYASKNKDSLNTHAVSFALYAMLRMTDGFSWSEDGFRAMSTSVSRDEAKNDYSAREVSKGFASLTKLVKAGCGGGDDRGLVGLICAFEKRTAKVCRI
jgi:hypothetical protein